MKQVTRPFVVTTVIAAIVAIVMTASEITKPGYAEAYQLTVEHGSTCFECFHLEPVKPVESAVKPITDQIGHIPLPGVRP